MLYKQFGDEKNHKAIKGGIIGMKGQKSKAIGWMRHGKICKPEYHFFFVNMGGNVDIRP